MDDLGPERVLAACNAATQCMFMLTTNPMDRRAMRQDIPDSTDISAKDLVLCKAFSRIVDISLGGDGDIRHPEP